MLQLLLHYYIIIRNDTYQFIIGFLRAITVCSVLYFIVFPLSQSDGSVEYETVALKCILNAGKGTFEMMYIQHF